MGTVIIGVFMFLSEYSPHAISSYFMLYFIFFSSQVNRSTHNNLLNLHIVSVFCLYLELTLFLLSISPQAYNVQRSCISQLNTQALSDLPLPTFMMVFYFLPLALVSLLFFMLCT